MQKIIISLLFISFLASSFSFINQAQAQYLGICSGEKLIYSQDTRFTPGNDHDTAIINDRNGKLLVKQRQSNDDYVIWRASAEISFMAGERLYYQGSGHDRLSFDVLDANRNLVQKITYPGSPDVIQLNQNGFIRFNAGERAREYNTLVLCPQFNNPNPNPVNRAPVWFQAPAQSVGAGQALQFTVSATDPDGQALIFSAVSLPTDANFDINSRNFTWTPNANQLGSHAAIFRVSDGSLTADMSVGISVYQNYQPPVYQPPAYQPPVYQPPVYQPPVYNYPYSYPYTYPNQPPYWFPVPEQAAQTGRVVQFNVFATDPNGDYLTYSASTMPVGASFDSYNRIFSWSPAHNQIGRHTVVFIVSDGSNKVDTSVYINVYGSGYSPTSPLNFPVINPAINTVTYNQNNDGLIANLYRQVIDLQTKVINALVNKKETVVVTTPVVTEKLKISNIRIEQERGRAVVYWETNRPASSGVVYDIVSGADVTKDYGSAYAYSVPADHNPVTNHRVVLGKLDQGTTYYLRVVSQVGEEMAVSSERSFVQLAVIGWTLFNPWLILLLLLIVLAIVVVIVKR